ncbi:MAG TPA: hypothetical protein VM581_02735 [Magnetospirillaceae bacterium]|nr:hypothetical protein [Magnetospirillaceae bacterium]
MRVFGVTVRVRHYCLLVMVFFAYMVLFALPASAVTGVNEQINYQGRLLDGTGAVVADGTYNLEFKIYQDGDGCVTSGTSPCSGTLKWTETRTGSNKVTVRNGYFSVQLGEVTAFSTNVNWNQSVLWLSVNVGGTGTPTWDGEMTPFRRIGAAAYSFNSKQLGGIDASQYLQLAPSAAQVDTSVVSSLFINKTGASGNILQLQKNAADVLTVGNTGAITAKNTTDSTTAFMVQKTGSGIELFQIDSSNSRVYIGDTTPDATAVVLVLDTKNDAGDPSSSVDGAMYYNSDSKSFRCRHNTIWQDCDFASLRADWTLQEDFVNTSVTSLSIGSHGWLFASIGTGGTITKTNVGIDASDRDRFGVLQLNSPATITTGAHVRLDNTAIAGVPASMTVEFDFAPVNAAAAAGLQQTVRIGLHNSTSASAPTNGLYFQYNTTTTAANWFRCTQTTCVDTGVARTLTANQYQRFKIQTNAAGTGVEFFINEASVGTATTNLPGATAVYGPALNASTVDATIRQWKIDYFQMKRNMTTLR